MNVDGGTGYDDEARRVLRATEGGERQQEESTMEALRLIQAVIARAAAAEVDRAPHGSGRSEILAALTMLRQLREELAGWEPWLITAARRQGVSWASLAPALGVTSRQAAERRYLRLRPSSSGEPTGEQRVQAERTRRAGDRAVAQWARQNSAVLRRLAGQVSALPNLTAVAQQHADQVEDALADDDPTALLSPLLAAQLHLRTSHTGLADQIDDIAEHAAQLRRETRDRRGKSPDPPYPGLPG